MISNDWQVLPIAKLIHSVDSGYSAIGEDRQAQEGEAAVLTLAALSDGYFRPDRHKVVASDEATKLRVSPKRDRILISRSNTPDLVGAAVYVTQDYPCLFLSDLMWQLEPTDDRNFSLQWFCYLLQSPYGRTKIKRIAVGSSASMVKIGKAAFLSLEIPLPSLAEQRKIAAILGTWDEAIGAAEKLIAALKERKRGLMQRLLIGRVRFRGFTKPWKQTALGDFLSYTPRKVVKPSTAYTRMGVRSHGKGTFTELVEDPGSNAMDELYQVKGGDLIVNITFAWEQAIAIVDKQDEGALVSHRFPTYEFNQERINPDFFRYVMLTKRFLYELDLITPGGAGRNRVMNKTDFLKIHVELPSLEEQNRIASVLLLADEQIRNAMQYCDNLKQQKRGLMQRLLTGQVRVNTNHDITAT